MQRPFVIVLLGVAICSLGVTNDCRTPIEIEKILQRSDFTESASITVSPDGKNVAYSSRGRRPIAVPDRRYLDGGMPSGLVGSQIVVTDLSTNRAKSVCSERESCFRPSWSPDGSKLAYYSDKGGKVGLWEIELQTVRRKNLVPDRVRVSLWSGDEPQWSPDGKTVFFSRRSAANLEQLSGESKNANEKAEGKEAGLQRGYRIDNLAAIAKVDRASRQVKILIPESANPQPGYFRLSASGKWISYLSVPRHISPKQRPIRDLVIASSSDGTVRETIEDLSVPYEEYHNRSYRWHPVDDLIIYVRNGALWKQNIGGATKNLAPGITDAMDDPLLFSHSGDTVLIGRKPEIRSDYPFPKPTLLSLVALDDNPKQKDFPVSAGQRFAAATPAGPGLFWQGTKTEIAIAVFEQGSQKLIGIDLNTTNQRTLLEESDLRFSPRGVLKDGSVLARYEDSVTAPGLYRFKPDFQKGPEIGRLNPHISSLGQITNHSFKTEFSPNGGPKLILNTALLLPPGASITNKPATIVLGYPGDDLSYAANSFAGGNPTSTLPSEILLRAGYAVALVHLPIGPEGKAGEPLQEMTDSILPQITALEKSGLVAPNRFALMGQSYGGYMAAGIPAKTDRFQAAIAVSGIFDLGMQYYRKTKEGTSPGVFWAVGGQGRMGSSPAEDPQRYLRNSPVSLAQKISTPLLIIQGTEDFSYPEAEKMAGVVRKLGKQIEFASYSREGHVPDDWTVRHNAEAARKILGFLGKYLGPGICQEKRVAPDTKSSTVR